MVANFRIVQIVRNWGPVGGMESYVWHLSHALADQNYLITVICEKAHTKAGSERIQIIEIGQLRQKPRWLMYWRFANRVEKEIQALGLNQDSIIHSHERSISHDITTFHAMPFATIKKKAWFKQVSIRVWAYLKMEERELGYVPKQSVFIVPVSWSVSLAIQQDYPQTIKKNSSTNIARCRDFASTRKKIGSCGWRNYWIFWNRVGSQRICTLYSNC